MKNFFVILVGLLLISISLKAFEPIRISIVSTTSTSANLVVDVLNSDGTSKAPIITATSMTPDASHVISLVLNNPVWTNYSYSANDLLRITFGGVVLSIERMEVVIAKQSLFGATISPSELDQTLSGLAQNGTTAGQMLYWNGTAWVVIAATLNEGAALQMISGVPTWVGGTPTPNVTNPTTSKIWMDRNLGATQVATSSTDANAYGDLYQWGRDTDGHQIRTSATTTTLSSSDNPGHGDFITTSNSPYDWRSPQNTDLWQGVNGVNNPCPSGFRLPTEAELSAEMATWSPQYSAGAFASPLKLTVAGYRSSSGPLTNDAGGNYWSSTVNGTNSRNLSFYSSAAYMTTSLRATGVSVRCIKN